MRTTRLRQADLNLLVVFTVLAEERSVSRAATRLLLSQPAVSRALQRLRETFQDDLLVRTAKGYEPTPQGQRLILELEIILPKLDRLLSGSTYDPSSENATFRIAATDNATSALAPLMCRGVMPTARMVRVEFVAWHDKVFDGLAQGSIDLVLNANEGHVPTQMQSEAIYAEEFVCVVSTESKLNQRVTLKQYLAAEHVGVSIQAGVQTIPERRLAALGVTRNTVIQVPYFTAAVRCVAGTKYIATVPHRLAAAEEHCVGVKLLEPPHEMSGYKYMMIWHPRLNTDAAHSWLRETMRQLGKSLT